MARQIATLDLMSRGRLVVGVGLGDDGWSEFSSFGEVVDPRARGRRLDESLVVLQQLLAGERSVQKGEDLRVDSSAFLPRPIQNPVPIWAAGRWPKRRPLDRAARLQGFFPIFPQAVALRPPATPVLLEIRRELEVRGAAADSDLVITWPFSQADYAAGIKATIERMSTAGVTWILRGFDPTPAALEEVPAAALQGPPGS